MKRQSNPFQIRRQFGKISLEIYVSPKQREWVEKEYERLTGVNPNYSKHFQVYNTKWGIECRIYFNEYDSNINVIKNFFNVLPNDFPYMGEYSYRINDCNLFWRLIIEGCRLGHNY